MQGSTVGDKNLLYPEKVQNSEGPMDRHREESLRWWKNHHCDNSWLENHPRAIYVSGKDQKRAYTAPLRFT